MRAGDVCVCSDVVVMGCWVYTQCCLLPYTDQSPSPPEMPLSLVSAHTMSLVSPHTMSPVAPHTMSLVSAHTMSLVSPHTISLVPSQTQNIANHVAQRPELFPQVLKTLFEIVLFEDCTNQWSLSRPMLSLILVNENIYNELKMQIVGSQPPERQVAMAACLDKLMQDVQRNLDPKNRDKFTQSLTAVRHEFRNKVAS